MNSELLGLNHLLSLSAICHAVTPLSSALSSDHLRAAPPKSSSRIPKCSLYQCARALLSCLDLKNTPPIPVIFATLTSWVSHRIKLGQCDGLRAIGQAKIIYRAANLTAGKLFRRVNKNGKTWGDGLTEKAVWHAFGRVRP